MIPLRDSTRSLRRPYVNWFLIALNLYIFIHEIMLPRGMLNQLFLQYGLIPADVFYVLATGGPLAPVLLTFITATFLHGGWLHVLGNMLYLFIFGDNVEDRLGHFRYLLFYLTAGVVAGVVQVLVDPTSQVPVVGASGAVAGVLGAYFVTFPRARVLTLVPILFFFTIIEVPAVIFLAIWFILQVFNGTASINQSADMVAWWAHIGGFIFGMLAIKVLMSSRASYYYPRH
ncbi:rhomboid family intramembrane serine protease [Desulfurispora thermophila]|uniref:rhomboid family intramembrane serine protease n=1 Tax=Desulfurispora thermophila TaxID=265470 RepID=UPI0003719747|nr:rhomboid family intramembrane serine protease [Desulfurispora thermophila]